MAIVELKVTNDDGSVQYLRLLLHSINMDREQMTIESIGGNMYVPRDSRMVVTIQGHVLPETASACSATDRLNVNADRREGDQHPPSPKSGGRVIRVSLRTPCPGGRS